MSVNSSYADLNYVDYTVYIYIYIYIYIYMTVLAIRDHFVGLANFAFLHGSIAFRTPCNVKPLALSSQVPFWSYV